MKQVFVVTSISVERRYVDSTYHVNTGTVLANTSDEALGMVYANQVEEYPTNGGFDPPRTSVREICTDHLDAIFDLKLAEYGLRLNESGDVVTEFEKVVATRRTK